MILTKPRFPSLIQMRNFSGNPSNRWMTLGKERMFHQSREKILAVVWTMPQTWCGRLITPIYKSGGRSDPANYRGICDFSCLEKLFCSTLNQRLLEVFVSLNILLQISNWLFYRITAQQTTSSL